MKWKGGGVDVGPEALQGHPTTLLSAALLRQLKQARAPFAELGCVILVVVWRSRPGCRRILVACRGLVRVVGEAVLTMTHFMLLPPPAAAADTCSQCTHPIGG